MRAFSHSGVALILFALCACADRQLQEVVRHEVAGSVMLPPTSDAVVVKLYTADGQELLAYPDMDGAFQFRDVPPGSHMLQPFSVRYYFPEVRDCEPMCASCWSVRAPVCMLLRLPECVQHCLRCSCMVTCRCDWM